MKNKSIIILALLITLFNLNLNGQALQKWKLVEKENLSFNVKVPENFLEMLSDNGNNLEFFSKDVKENSIQSLRFIIRIGIAQKQLDLSQSFGIHKDYLKKNRSEFSLGNVENSNIGDLKVISYDLSFKKEKVLWKEKGFFVVANGKTYALSYVCFHKYNEHFLPQFLTFSRSFDPDAYLPFPTVTMVPPTGWTSVKLKNKNIISTFCSNEELEKSVSTGIIKIKIVRNNSKKSLQQFVFALKDKIKKERSESSSGVAAIPNLNGRKYFYFNVNDKDDLFLERHHVTKEKGVFVIIYFISTKENFNNKDVEKSLKAKLAKALMSLKIE